MCVMKYNDMCIIILLCNIIIISILVLFYINVCVM